ncbi:helix-turn-helix transcriptional regulator [Robertkochia aurantiaca]|uniref:helix-turn-helix transcriptional regulator n=1 Tax=Robertkochia aurantiaca TaxID=2873700 RepID=UPI001CCD3890|nr:helix-turn-helix transcriptional regulator [Robertkochia sp. 3YJGBD-33]
MDQHIIRGLSPEEVERLSSAKKEKAMALNCTVMLSWKDHDKGLQIQLIDAPDRDVIQQIHDDLPGCEHVSFTEIEEALVDILIDRFEGQPVTGSPGSSPSSVHMVYIESEDDILLSHQLGIHELKSLQASFSGFLRDIIGEYLGEIIEISERTQFIAFSSLVKTLNFLKILNEVRSDSYRPMSLKIGVHSGVVCSDARELTRQSLRLSRILGKIAQTHKIFVSSSFNELAANKLLDVCDYISPVYKMTGNEECFLLKLAEVLETNWQDPDFELSDLSDAVQLSKTQLYRKCTSIIGKSPNALVRDYRLCRALKMLKATDRNVSEVAYDSGFNNPSYFSKCFNERYGVRPLDYLNLKKASLI